MNKLLTKIATSFVGIAMAIGVGVAVGISGQEAVPVSAASATWNKITSNPVSGTNYLILSSDGKKYFDASVATIDSTSNPVAITVSNNSVTGDYDGKAWTFTKSGDNWYISRTLNNTTTYIGRTANSNGINTGSSGIANTITNSSGAFTIKGTGSGSSKQMSYNASSGRFRYFASGTVMLFEKAVTPQTITVDPASKEAYTDETISLTTSATSASWALSNNTCGASLSAASGKTVTVSATGAGSVRVTATATGYTSPYVDLTFSERPTSPYITPEKSSTSGYTGQNESISFSYGNLTGSLSVTSSNTSVVTVETPSYSAGEGTVQFNFVGAGSTTVKFYDGSTELASVSVSVTASSVTITGLASTGSVYVGKTSDLSTGVTVTAVGSYSNAVTWASDATSVATVSSAGVVTGVSEGTAHISVTSVDYPSATMSCTVTVSEVVSYELVTDVSKLADGTQFVLVDYVSNTYRIAKDLNSGHIKMNTVTSKTEVSGTSSGDTVVTEEADVFTLVGSAGSWEIKRGDTYLQFTGTSNGNDSFTSTSSADTKFSIVASGTANKITINSNSRSNRALRYNTSTGDLRNYANTGSQPDLYMYAIIPASNELDSVTTSGQTTSFTAGNNFSYGGTLTAHYTLEEDATVTPTSYKYGDSGIDPTTAGTAITTSTTLTKAEHDGKYIYVVYTEDKITKYCSYQITVNYAAVTSVVIGVHAAEIGLNEAYDDYLDTNKVSVTINSQYADQGYEWIVHANTVGDDYSFDGSGLKSKDTEGTITLWCRSTADNSKYDELVVTVTGDPTAVFTPESVSGYVGKGTSVAFTYGNMDDTSKISVSSNDASVTVGAITASAGEGSVAITFVSAGSATLSISYDGGSALDTVGVTVSTDSVTALTWSAPTIKVYSGATTTVSDASSWNVHYTMASGDYGSLVYGEYTLKLGGSSITLPHTWDASEDGKVLSIEYGGFASPTTSTVNVTQTLRAVMAPVEGEPTTSTLTFTEKYSEGGATADDSKAWTVASDGTESNFDSTKGIHYGTSSASVQYIKLTSSDFTSGKITKVEVNASTASGVSATVSVTVSGEAFGGDPQSLSTSATNYTFTGNVDAGTIEVLITKPSSATKAIYCKSVAVTYVESSGTQNIANVAGHEAAQKAVVAFAKAMNAAFDNTANCTEGVAAAWATASSAYSSNIANNASLSADEKAYAKNLIKYASDKYTENTDNDYSYCLERAMATYKACIQKHGQTAFMSDVRSVSPSSRIIPLSIINGNGNTVAIVAIVSMISVIAIGGYFFLRKRKED